jgi:sugar (pentulose or hexulose) kinase
VAYLERLGYERLAALGAPRGEPVITAGGGTRSPVWSKIRATVLGDGVAVAADASTSMGACLLAAAGTIHPDLTAAGNAMVQPARMIEPDAATRAAMDDGYGRWTEALRRLGRLDQAASPAGA